MPKPATSVVSTLWSADSPKQRQITSRLRGDDGRLLSGQAEVQLITAYGNQTFAAHPDEPYIAPLAQALLAKAVPAISHQLPFGRHAPLSSAVCWARPFDFTSIKVPPPSRLERLPPCVDSPNQASPR